MKAIGRRNITFLMLKYSGNLENFVMIDNDGLESTISDVIDYDALTHVYTVEFTNGEILQISDKNRYEFKIPDITNIIDIKKPNKKRKRFR